VVVGGFMFIKNIIACSEVCLDVDFEIIAVEVKEWMLNIMGNYRYLQSSKLRYDVD